MEPTLEEETPHNTVHRESQTAADFIDQQLSLEHDAREVLPYEVYACLTCSPPPASAAQVYQPAGVCYACSISCHTEHNLVELFNRRNFTCDCGTTRMPDTSPCTLRSDPETGSRGVHSQEAAKGNRYNHNFQNKFCACGEEYDADKEKGTMFQCIGLGTVETGGCGEDWYHPECLMGLPKDWNKKEVEAVVETGSQKSDSEPTPPGFPHEDDFEAMVCYKCVESNPWIKRYASTTGFLPPVFKKDTATPTKTPSTGDRTAEKPNLKRKASEEDVALEAPSSPSKRLREDPTPPTLPPGPAPATDPTMLTPSNPVSAHATITSDPIPIQLTSPRHKHSSLPPAPTGIFTLFMKEDFRDHLCHCPKCYPNLLPHPQLIEEEDTYEPSISNSSQSHPAAGSGTRSHGTGSLLERGEAALNNIDRVRAIEGVMVYNHLRDKVKAFLKPYAESGKVVEADDIKAYFEKLRGDDQAIREAGKKPVPEGDGDENEGGGGGEEGDKRREQSGY